MKYKLMIEERAKLAEEFPGLILSTDETGGQVTGVMEVIDGIGYTVNLEFSTNYPDDVPVLHCQREEIAWEEDRHVCSGGKACLCVESEYGKHWPPGSSLADFLRVLVHPYFVGQAYYEAHGSWPLDGERSHGVSGIVDAYREMLGFRADCRTIMAFVTLIAKPNHPKGSIECPCGSGRSLRQCHRQLLSRLRRETNSRRRHVGNDLERLRAAHQCGPTSKRKRLPAVDTPEPE